MSRITVCKKRVFLKIKLLYSLTLHNKQDTINTKCVLEFLIHEILIEGLLPLKLLYYNYYNEF